MTRGGWGEGTLTDLGGGKWKLRLPPYLGRSQKTFRARTKTEARQEQRRLLDEAYREKFNPTSPTVTFDELCDRELARHVADPHTTYRLRMSLKLARDAFGMVPLDELRHDHIADWRADVGKRLAPATLHGYTQAVKQMLNAAVKAGLLDESPARHVRNPQPSAGAITPFERLDEVIAVAGEMPQAYMALPVFGCLTGLRVEELLPLERGDIRNGYVYVNKRIAKGVFKPGTKNGSPERRVVLDPLAAEWLDRQPRRIDTRLIWPREDGRWLNLKEFRENVWDPAVEAAGVDPRRRLKDMRHTYATWQLTGNCNTWTLSKQMGTSVKNIEDTYGRWIRGSEQVALAAMAQFLEGQTAAK